ncbi:hypothetical protein [Nocardia sp. NPDC004722]
MTPEQIRRAQLQVAGHATDVEDCRAMLAMLGLLESVVADDRPKCRECRYPMVPFRHDGLTPEGFRRRYLSGLCGTCYRSFRNYGDYRQPGWRRTAQAAPVVAVKPKRRRLARDLDFQTRVAELRAVQGRTWGEIASVLGCATGTARSSYAQVVPL